MTIDDAVSSDTVALMPAAGAGTRLALRSGSKEMVLVPDSWSAIAGGGDPARRHAVWRPVCDSLLDQFRSAGLAELTLLRRGEKTDLRDHVVRCTAGVLRVNDVVLAPTPGTPHTLLEGCRRAPEQDVAFGFPDMILSPSTMLRDTLATLRRSDADIALALIRPADPPIWDMAVLDGDRVQRLDVRPGPSTRLCWGWCMAVWRPSFTDFLQHWLASDPDGYSPGGEVAVGHVIAAAARAGLHVTGARIATGSAHDIGTPAGLSAAQAERPRR